MSIDTIADNKLNDAKVHIKLAIDDLSEITIKQVWGTENYSDTYLTKLQDSLNALLKIRHDLGA